MAHWRITAERAGVNRHYELIVQSATSPGSDGDHPIGWRGKVEVHRQPRPSALPLYLDGSRSMRRPVVVALALAAGFAMWRQPLTGIRLIRWLDQRSGIDGRSGARVYDRLLAPMAGWLYQRVAADVAMTLGDQVAPIIVDVGTGPGFLLIAVAARCPTATIIGIDPAEPMRVAA